MSSGLGILIVLREGLAVPTLLSDSTESVRLVCQHENTNRRPTSAQITRIVRTSSAYKCVNPTGNDRALDAPYRRRAGAGYARAVIVECPMVCSFMDSFNILS